MTKNTSKASIGDPLIDTSLLQHIGNDYMWDRKATTALTSVYGVGIKFNMGHGHGEDESNVYSPTFGNIKEALQAPRNNRHIYRESNGQCVDREDFVMLNAIIHVSEVTKQLDDAKNKAVTVATTDYETKKNRIERELSALNKRYESELLLIDKHVDIIKVHIGAT